MCSSGRDTPSICVACSLHCRTIIQWALSCHQMNYHEKLSFTSVMTDAAIEIARYASTVRSAVDCIARIRLARSAGVSVAAIAGAIYAPSMRSAIDCIAWVLAITIYSKIPLLTLARIFDACAMLATFAAVRANTIDIQAEDEWFSRVVVKIEYA